MALVDGPSRRVLLGRSPHGSVRLFVSHRGDRLLFSSRLIDFGGLLGAGRVMEVSRFSSADFVRRGGFIPAPLSALTN